ncbi:hypothetical protein QCA50_011482 [Cerrena zonata]|uniref:Uncharacterized protein n=1 Tax=Cerrena zonata TaxID=2478898 RepID=A0AAW0G9B2_9APHY
MVHYHPHRNTLRSYIRRRLSANFRAVTGGTQPIPWSNHGSLQTRFKVEICGWPAGVEFRSISVMGVSDLGAVVVAIEQGLCYFRKLDLPAKRRKGRSDKDEIRGRQMCPFKPHQKIGLIFQSPRFVRGELPEDPIEESP